MINFFNVLDTVTANSADFQVTANGNLNITGLPQIDAGSITNIEVIPASAEQIKKQTLTFTAANSTYYSFNIQGYALSTGTAVTKTVYFTSAAAATTSTISAQAAAAVEALSDFNVGATDSGSGVIVLTASAATATCPNAPLFNIIEANSNIALTTDATATCAAAPTGGVTAILEPVFNSSGVMTSIRIINRGAGYLAAPAITIANGAGAGSSAPTATCTIFEGEVVAVQFTAGTSYAYTAYEGFTVVGTGAAIKAKYGYIANANNRAVPTAFQKLSSLTDAYNYTEIIISYTTNPPAGTTQYTTTTNTAQASLCVYESATNANDIIAAGYGSVANLRKGYRVQFQAAVALDGSTGITTSAFVIATGVLTLSAAQSNGIKSGDILLVGTTPSYRNTADTNAIAKVLGVASNTSLVCQIGGNNLVAAITGQALATRAVIREAIVG